QRLVSTGVIGSATSTALLRVEFGRRAFRQWGRCPAALLGEYIPRRRRCRRRRAVDIRCVGFRLSWRESRQLAFGRGERGYRGTTGRFWWFVGPQGLDQFASTLWCLLVVVLVVHLQHR